jgi:membrane-associated phospholipid phosphatase
MSDVLAAGIVPAVALGAMTFDAWRQGEIDEAGVDLLLVAEAASAVMFVNGIVKLAAARQRPYAAHAPEGAARDDEDNLSFYSGHSALTFSTVVGSATVAWLRRRRTAPWILAIGLPLAAATAWLRMAADRHWATDVGTGAALGAAFGFAIPLFHGPP